MARHIRPRKKKPRPSVDGMATAEAWRKLFSPLGLQKDRLFQRHCFESALQKRKTSFPGAIVATAYDHPALLQLKKEKGKTFVPLRCGVTITRNAIFFFFFFLHWPFYFIVVDASKSCFVFCGWRQKMKRRRRPNRLFSNLFLAPAATKLFTDFSQRFIQIFCSVDFLLDCRMVLFVCLTVIFM